VAFICERGSSGPLTGRRATVVPTGPANSRVVPRAVPRAELAAQALALARH
jgi:hypothetical protein